MALSQHAKTAVRQWLRQAARAPRARRALDLIAQELHEIAQVETASIETRTFYQMRRPVPVIPTHHSNRCRVFRPGLDELQLTEVLRDAFAWDVTSRWDLALLRSYLASDWFDPRGLVVYEEGEKILGTCLVKVERSAVGPIGEFVFVAVTPSSAGRGIGRQLVSTGLDYLSSVEVPQSLLYVDAANLPAVHLYLSLGFAVHRIERRFGEVPVLSVPAGDGPT